MPSVISNEDATTKMACKTCGSPASTSAQIQDLENQVRVLTEQSADALNRLAGYEEEIRQLRVERNAAAAAAAAAITPAATPVDPQHSYNNSVDSAASGYGLARFTSFRTTRKPSNTSNPAIEHLGDLQTQLQKEVKAREEAEKKAQALNNELEDLSANLFEQANEMVATERKARSKLEERVAMLEQRDRDKSKRLERIEGALQRLDRVRTLLAPPSPP